MIENIQIAAKIMIANPNLSDSELVDLVAPKISGHLQDTWLLVEILPIAFASVIIERMGVIRSPNFIRNLDTGDTSPEIPFNSLSIWTPSVGFAVQQLSSLSQDEYFAIASRSSEMNAINKVISSGGNPEGGVLGPTIFFREIAQSELPHIPIVSKKAPWWKFW